MKPADSIKRIFAFGSRAGMNGRTFSLIRPYDPVVVFYVLAGVILSRLYDFRIDWNVLIDFRYDIHFLKFTAVILLVFIPIYYLGLRMEKRKRPKESVSEIYEYVKGNFLGRAKVYEFFRVLLTLKILLTVYCIIKQAIPIINPKLYDDMLRETDRMLHMGFSPNLFCLKYLSNRTVTVFFDTSYLFWYFLKVPMILIFIWFTDPKIRDHFFFSYFFLWIIGGFFAVLFPSVGPVYRYPDLYAGLNIPHAAELQRRLWIHYSDILVHPENFRTFIYEGIAAFPSLHVAVIALFCIFSKKLNKMFFIFMIVYVVIVQIGSVLLGWHYAVDGYFGILLAFFSYFISRPKSKRVIKRGTSLSNKTTFNGK